MDSDYQKDLDRLIKIAIETGNSLQGQRIEDETNTLFYSEGLGQKILHHIITAVYLSAGYQLGSKNEIYAAIIDFGSIAVLSRAAIESYLTFHYIFIHPKDDAVKRFRFLCWHISGFLDRADHQPKEAKHISLKKEEKVQLNIYMEELKQNTYYIGLTSKAQERARKGEWRLFDGWSILATNAGFKERLFRQQYKYLSSFAHSGRLSVIQIQQTKNLAEQAQMAASSKSILILILAKFIYDYIELIPALHHLKNETQEYSLILHWKMIAEHIDQPIEDTKP